MTGRDPRDRAHDRNLANVKCEASGSHDISGPRPSFSILTVRKMDKVSLHKPYS